MGGNGRAESQTGARETTNGMICKESMTSGDRKGKKKGQTRGFTICEEKEQQRVKLRNSARTTEEDVRFLKNR